ncbi:hypothetical protein AVEN_262155-1 [Araneus ventricosus]|uniref:Uncharacterized protein n=1 Tax=Araneus ventricosus TaxID=182803 RepID=A0A4Y2EKC2_ARAVE|nr:hypothetical protein AVEN_262155-1 [Araneus ventricosus]
MTSIPHRRQTSSVSDGSVFVPRFVGGRRWYGTNENSAMFRKIAAVRQLNSAALELPPRDETAALFFSLEMKLSFRSELIWIGEAGSLREG